MRGRLGFFPRAAVRCGAGYVVMCLSAFACADDPPGGAGYVVTDNDAGAAAVVFAEQRKNGQYCIYRRDFAIGTSAADGLLDVEVRGDAQLLTAQTVAADDLRRAVEAESVYTSYKFPAAAYALFPTATVCLATFTAWVASRHVALRRATVLTCAAGVSLVGAVLATEAVAAKESAATIDAILSPGIHRADDALPRVEKVLGWLVTENSLPCHAETESAP